MKSPTKSSCGFPAKRSQPPSSGKLSKPEIRNLIMQAKEAFDYQIALKNIPADSNFDDWRRDQVQAAVGRSGLSKIVRSHFRTVRAHFLTLAGDDAEAYLALTTTGPKSDTGNPHDTHESSDEPVALIRQALDHHNWIATVDLDAWLATLTDPPAPGYLSDLRAAQAHIKAHASGPIGYGWFLHAARQRTGKPTLTMDTLSDRLDATTLFGLLSHTRNHISRREGREQTERRAKRRYPKKPDPGEMDDPF
jgi:hypothetical protein